MLWIHFQQKKKDRKKRRKKKGMAVNMSKEKKSLYKQSLKKLKRVELIVSSICVFGILICLYSLQVEIYSQRDKGYTALCDIGPFSCSKVFNSKYGKGFGLLPEDSPLNLPNSIFGLVFFIMQLLLLLFRNNQKALKMKIFLSVMANLGSVYLGCILYFVLQDFCIVCCSLYVVNAFLLFFNYRHFKYSYELGQISATVISTKSQ